MNTRILAVIGWAAGLLAPWSIADEAVEAILRKAGPNHEEIRGFIETAGEKHDRMGRDAAIFLVQHMPERDLRALKRDFLLENLSLALKAREEFSWAAKLPEEVFLNDVLPYASLDETRELWRPEFYAKAREMVKDCRTAAEAAQVLNRDFFNLIKVHYNTGRKKPNQSPGESRALGKATCTGLSIILVDACRSVGVPARVAGTPLWTNKRGNHTWVEIYDRGSWHYTGADEYNKGGLNRAWFTGSATTALEDDWKHAIWASSWKKTGTHFPMVWALDNREVGGVNVTRRYAAKAKPASESVPLHVRVLDRKGGARVVAELELLGPDGSVAQKVKSKAGRADLNDMATLMVKPGTEFRLRIRGEGATREISMKVDKETTREIVLNE